MVTSGVGDVPAIANSRECCSCRRWVTAALLAVGPIGSEAMCGLCVAIGELRDAIRRNTLSEHREEAVHQALWRAHVLVVNSGRGPPSRPYAPLVTGDQAASE